MPWGLLKQGLRKSYLPRGLLPRRQALKDSYDVVIIGAGGHGLAAAYYLAKEHGITDIAVLDKGYLAGGNTARNTAIVRSNYLTPEGVSFYDESMKLWGGLSNELDFNIQLSNRGHLTLAHADSTLRTMRWRAEVNKHLDVDSDLVYPDDIRRLCPHLDLSEDVRWPILGALYHPPGSTARHDAVAWGYAHGASKRGVEIHEHTEVTGLQRDGQRVTAVETDRGTVRCGRVLQAVAGASSVVGDMAGLRLPIRTVPLQACVSIPLMPFLDPIIVSGTLHTYVWQTARGELVMGGSSDPYPGYTTRSTLDFKEGLIAHLLELFPFLAEVRLMRQWAGMTDMTPDFSPIMGKTHLDNYYIDAGWGTWGFKATPVCGRRMAETVATGRVPEILHAFDMGRFSRFDQVGERGAASVGH
ncbi:MAG: FAD-dependent oxidoreductase [Halofilum sp. (in: g-proteobacteria)]|nr:FAD-dependent oxidoreductase [Halofilum sp. (in: g-proteobacteria)]